MCVVATAQGVHTKQPAVYVLLAGADAEGVGVAVRVVDGVGLSYGGGLTT